MDANWDLETMVMLQKIENMTDYKVGQGENSEFPFLKTGYLVAERNEAEEPDIPGPMTQFIFALHRHEIEYFLLDDFVNGRLYLLFRYQSIDEASCKQKGVLRKALDVVLTEMEKLYPMDNFYAVIQEIACMRVFMKNLSRDTIVLPAGFFHLQNVEKVTGHRVLFQWSPFQHTRIFSLKYVVGTEDGENYIPTAIARFISLMDSHGIGYVVVHNHVESYIYLYFDATAAEDSIPIKELNAAVQAYYEMEGGGFSFVDKIDCMRLRVKYLSPEARVLSPAGFAHLKEMDDTNPLLLVSRLWASPTQTSLVERGGYSDTSSQTVKCDQCGHVNKKRRV